MSYHRQFTVEDTAEKDLIVNCNILDVISITDPSPEDIELLFSIKEIGEYKLIQNFYRVTRTL